jgi:hypothetical protein
MEQDYAKISGRCVVRADNASEVAAAIRRWEAKNSRFEEPRVEGDTVRATLHYGPVLGAWPADLRRVWHKLVGEGGEVKDAHREVVQKRTDYDG